MFVKNTKKISNFKIISWCLNNKYSNDEMLGRRVIIMMPEYCLKIAPRFLPILRFCYYLYVLLSARSSFQRIYWIDIVVLCIFLIKYNL